MSTEEKDYTELDCYTQPPEDIYTSPAPEPVLRANATLETTKTSPSKRGCWIKLLVIATIINFLLAFATIGTLAYFLHAQAGKPQEARPVSMFEGSAAADITRLG